MRAPELNHAAQEVITETNSLTSGLCGVTRLQKKRLRNALNKQVRSSEKKGDDVFLIYPSIAKEAYERWRNNYQRQMDDLKERAREIEDLEKEMKTMNELREIWVSGLGEIKLGEFEGKVSPGVISSFVSKKFQIEESRLMLSKERVKSARKELEKKIRALKEKIENLREKLEYA